MKNLENWWENICIADKKIRIAKKLAEKEQKRLLNLKRKSNYIPKTFFGFGRNFKRCENCLHATITRGACKGKNKKYCKYRGVFVNKLSELLCFNVQIAQNYVNLLSGKILFC
jgi:hypothetical protein